MGSQIKIFSSSDEMASFNCDSRGSVLFMLTTDEVGLTAKGMEITERGASDQVHTGC